MSARSSSSAAETIARAAKEAFDESQTRLSGPHADEIRNAALESIRKALEEAKEEIRAANEKDMEVSDGMG